MSTTHLKGQRRTPHGGSENDPAQVSLGMRLEAKTAGHGKDPVHSQTNTFGEVHVVDMGVDDYPPSRTVAS